MKRWLILFALLFAVSLALNVYFIVNNFELSTLEAPFGENYQLTNSSDNSFSVTTPSKRLTSINPTNEYATTYDNLESNEAEERVKLLSRANTWLHEGDYVSLNNFLNRYLKQYPLDMDFLLIEAQMKVATTLLSDAIAHYYDLLRNSMTFNQQKQIENQIRQLSFDTIEQLSSSYSWDVLASFVEPLLQLDPNNRLYILSLANAYAELYQEGLMETVLASLDYDDPDALNIRKIIASQQIIPIESKETEVLTEAIPPTFSQAIALKKYGDQYVIEAKLSKTPVSLLIDTGASVTAVSEQFFEKLRIKHKLKFLGSFNINTAGGSVVARMVQFKKLTIGHVSVENLAVVILPLEGINYADGLLGMNFLREFDFKIDQKQAVIFIQK